MRLFRISDEQVRVLMFIHKREGRFEPPPTTYEISRGTKMKYKRVRLHLCNLYIKGYVESKNWRWNTMAPTGTDYEAEGASFTVFS